jgi:hypothetical protein
MNYIQEEYVGLKGCVGKLMEVVPQVPLFPAGDLEPKFAGDYSQRVMLIGRCPGNTERPTKLARRTAVRTQM